MKEPYDKAEIEIVVFPEEDVIMTSSEDPADDPGTTGDWV